MIHCERLTKRFGDRTAVDGLDLHIASGTICGLLGPNGAGKSTTINMFLGLVRPDSGVITLDGNSDLRSPALRRKIGVSPQALAIYDELTAAENLRFFGRLYGQSGSRLSERVAASLGFAGLSDRQSDLASSFSGGMKRRLNLACALLHEPSILFLDEPTVGMDPQSRNMMLDQLLTLRQSGKTIVYTTHYMEEASRLCDMVAIIDAGRILASGTVDELLTLHGGDTTIEAEFADSPSPRFGVAHGVRTATLQTADPGRTLAELTAAGIPLTSLRMERPTLESVFLHLTGKSLRD